ncbi:helix-turn-helix domain-containing protein [Mesorhizobium sp. 1B3]|uniref:helix-turn-helix domain-containing protein n=1 Tax=Mesorhizobium sp. 1B3 TaxID=3243599 RepID=UPI003D98CF7A
MSFHATNPEAPLRLVRQTPELAGIVEEIICYRENGRGIESDVETAALVVPLVINFGDRFGIGLGCQPGIAGRYGSFTSGLFAGPVIINSTGNAECIQINFTPLGAWRFFGLPMSELSARMVTLDELGDREINRLRQHLADEADWKRRFDMIEDFVIRRVRRSPPADPALGWAYRYMLDNGGQIRIADIAGKLDWSRKHLAQRFRLQLGLPPKAIARIIRFRAALSMSKLTGQPDWADIAAACGYADQAHLTREFGDLAGMSPTRWHAKAA